MLDRGVLLDLDLHDPGLGARFEDTHGELGRSRIPHQTGGIGLRSHPTLLQGVGHDLS